MLELKVVVRAGPWVERSYIKDNDAKNFFWNDTELHATVLSSMSTSNCSRSRVEMMFYNWVLITGAAPERFTNVLKCGSELGKSDCSLSQAGTFS